MLNEASLTQPLRFEPKTSVTKLIYTRLPSGDKVNTNSFLSIFSKNSSSSGVIDSPVRKLERLMKSFKDLEYGWNGDSAKPIPDSVIKTSQEILFSISSKLPEVYPTGRESIQLEYDKNEKSLEIEIFEDRFEIAIFDQTDLLSEDVFRLDEKSKINEHIAKFI